MLPTIYYALLGLITWILYKTFRQHKKPFPPGPKPLPLIGNVLDMPKHHPWITYAKWKEQYGDLVHLNVMGSHILILNSEKVAVDILEKRSAKTSGRPYSVMLHELIDLDWFVIKGYDTSLRTQRKLFRSCFNENTPSNHRPIQERAVHHFLRRLLDQPDDFLSLIRLQFAEVIMDVLYGIKVKDFNNIFVGIIEKAVHAFVSAAVPGRFLVDTFPLLKYIPSWFPGAGFKKIGAQYKIWTKQAMDEPAAYVKESMQKGTAGPSALTHLLEKCEEPEYVAAAAQAGITPEKLARAVSVIAYAAGSDTVTSAMQTFFWFIANHPECQEAAHAELDAVLSGTRLPTWDDLDDLPYIHALTKEVLRCQPVHPLGVPHCLDEDDEYEGYFIPKGTVLVPNAWLILRNPEVYPDPHTFNPMRWLIKTEKGFTLNKSIPDLAPFGYGRRVCPGKYFAVDSLLMTIAAVLTCFTLSPLESDGPRPSLLENFTDNLVIFPLPFKLSIKPRSEAAARLVREIHLPQ